MTMHTRNQRAVFVMAMLLSFGALITLMAILVTH